MADLVHSESRIPDRWSITFKLLLIATFYLTKTENRAKKSLHSSYTIALSKGPIFVKKCWLFAKKLLNSVKLRGTGVIRYILWN